MIKKRVIVLMILVITTLNIYAQKEKLQTAYIYNFITKYFDWPAANKTGDFVIGVLGNSPIIDEFRELASARKVGSQRIVVKTFKSADVITDCHVLYIVDSKAGELDAALAKAGTTLIISDFESAVSKGVAINFKTVNDKQSFELKAQNAASRGLIVSPDLGKLFSQK
jgi:hypothetical protein